MPWHDMKVVARFTLSVVVAATAVSCAGRTLSDFDEPAGADPHDVAHPHDVARGVGVWAVAVLIAAWNEMRIRRQRREASR